MTSSVIARPATSRSGLRTVVILQRSKIGSVHALEENVEGSRHCLLLLEDRLACGGDPGLSKCRRSLSEGVIAGDLEVFHREVGDAVLHDRVPCSRGDQAGGEVGEFAHALFHHRMTATQREAAAAGGNGNAAALGAADWLSFAAAPTFAMMALLTGVLGGGPLDALVYLVDGVASETHRQAPRLFVAPVIAGHLLPVRTEPRDVLYLRAANLTPLKKFPAAQHRVRVENLYKPSRELKKLAAAFVQVPIDPGDFVVLTPGVVVAALRAAQFVARDEHRHALRQEERREEVSLLSRA